MPSSGLGVAVKACSGVRYLPDQAVVRLERNRDHRDRRGRRVAASTRRRWCGASETIVGVRAGKIRAVGLSNFTGDAVREWTATKGGNHPRFETELVPLAS